MYFSFIATDAQDIVYDPKVGVLSQGTLSQISVIEDKYAALRNSSVPGFEILAMLFGIGMVSVILVARRHTKP